MNEAGSIADCKKGNNKAQKALFEIYSKGMLLLCKRYVKDNHYAEDILLSGFYKFFSTIDQFIYSDTKSVGAWLKGIMVNECLIFLRKNKHMTFVEEEFALNTTIIDADVLERMNSNVIFQLINALPDGYRIVFNLYIVEGYNHREIAEMLKISEGTSKSQLSRSKALLQSLLHEKK